MITERNEMGVPEIRNYRREEIEDGIIVTYEQRQPGEHDWRPVKLFQAIDVELSQHFGVPYHSSLAEGLHNGS